jgi:hypothetical protein
VRRNISFSTYRCVAIIAETLGYSPATIERHATDSASAYAQYITAAKSESNIVNADLIFEKARSRTAPPPPLPDAAPPAFTDDVRCRESPMTANDAFASIHTRPSSLVPASEDAPEESRTTKGKEHAQAVMSSNHTSRYEQA